MKERETGPQPQDISEDFMNLDETTFNERLNKIESHQVILNIPIGLLGANTFRNRLRMFLVNPHGQTRRATISATSREYETFGKQFEKDFPGVNWEITD